MNDCLTTPQHKNKSAIGCQTNGIYIKSKNQICLNNNNDDDGNNDNDNDNNNNKRTTKTTTTKTTTTQYVTQLGAYTIGSP